MDEHSALKLLLRLLKRNTDPDSIEADLITLSEPDWDLLISIAEQHLVLLIFYQRVLNLNLIDLIPKPILSSLKQSYLEATVKNMVMLHHTEIILTAFEERNIEVIALKGIHLIETVYSDIGFRKFADIDLLVKKSSLPLAITTMQALGYQMTTYYNPQDENLDIKHVPPFKQADHPFVEIHWTLLEEEEPFNIDPEILWQRAIPVTIADHNILALSPEDQILHLAIHQTYQHHLSLGLYALYDMALVLEKSQHLINWELLISTAKIWKAERVLYLTFFLLQSILDVKLPEDIYIRLIPQPVDETVLQSAKRQILMRKVSQVPLTPDLIALHETRGFAKKIKLILNRVFIPKNTLARLYNVQPNSIKIFFFYPVRLFSLIKSYKPTLVEMIKVNPETTSAIDYKRENIQLRHWMTGKPLDLS